jgi:competence protein ComEA
MWKKVLREYFAFPKKERRAIWVLFILWILLLLVQLYRTAFYQYKASDFSYSIIINQQFNELDEQALNSSSYKKARQRSANYQYYFKYIKYDDLRSLGMEAKDAAVIWQQKQKGLKLYHIHDVDSISGISNASKQILKNRLRFFESKKYFNSQERKPYVPTEITLVDLNTADTTAIDEIKGIGTGTAKRVLKYRERLGGYISIEQLKEVWGLDSAAFEILKKRIRIQENSQKRININTADVQTLGKHPYIGYSLAKLIVNYRLQHGNYTDVKELLNIHVMNEEILSKIESYIGIKND